MRGPGPPRWAGWSKPQAANAARAVMEHNATAAAYAVQDDLKVDSLEREIADFRDPHAGAAPAGRGRSAHDSSPASRSAGTWKRIGDYAANVAKRSLVLNEMAAPYTLSGIGHMCRLVQENLKITVDAIGEGQCRTRARGFGVSDIMIDDVYSAIFREQITYMMEDPRNITPLHASSVHCQEPRAYGRPCNQHCRDRALRDHGIGDTG